jgi:cytochrome c oxidase subunit 2
MRPGRRRLIIAGAALAFGAGALAQQPGEKVIRIVAKKFEYTPGEITLEKGVPVVLELTTEDVTMGFYAPDFKVDVEIVPGRTVQVRLAPDTIGSFEFSCDVFCGDGHEGMSGTIHVVQALGLT